MVHEGSTLQRRALTIFIIPHHSNVCSVSAKEKRADFSPRIFKNKNGPLLLPGTVSDAEQSARLPY